MRIQNILARAALAALILASLPTEGSARWWIFGKTKQEVDFDYLYVNGVSLSEAGPEITLYRDSLQNRMAYIRGKAVRGVSVGAVEISVDGGESWNHAEFTAQGSFEYGFSPSAAEYNLLVRMTETTGKINDVSRTAKRIVISNRSILYDIQKALDELAAAYSQKDARRFMSLVSLDFTVSDVILDSAIRKDFTAFAHLTLRLTAASAAADSSGKVHAVVNYSRTLVSVRDGKSYSDDSVTEFTFSVEPSGLKLYSMKHPLLFGLSEAGEVASGRSGIGADKEIIIIKPGGDVKKLPFDEAMDEIESDFSDSSTPIISSSLTSETRDHFRFSTGEKRSLPIRPEGGPPTDLPDGYDIGLMERDYLTVHSNVGYQLLPHGTDIGMLTEAPTSGYQSADTHDIAFYSQNYSGRCFAFKLRDGSYAVMEITEYISFYGDNYDKINFRFRYQSDGTNRF